MRNNSLTLIVPAAVGVGTAQNVRDLRDKYVQTTGTFTATMSIEGSLDGTNYVAVATGISTPSFVQVPQPLVYLRVRVTGYTSGTPGAIVGGFDENG